MAEESRLCFLAKFREDLQLGEVKKVFPCLKCQLLAIQYHDENVQLIDATEVVKKYSINSDTCKNLLKFKAKTLIWSSQQNVPSFVVLHYNYDSWKLIVYAVTDNGVLKITEQELRELSIELNTDSCHSLELLAFNGEILTLLLHSSLFILKVKSEGFSLMCKSTIRADVFKFQLYNNIIVFCEKSNTFLFYDLFLGEEIACIRLQDVLPDYSCIKSWRFSLDLESLCYIDTSNAVYEVNIQSYIEDHPSCVQTDQDYAKSNPCCYASSHTGDVVWKEKLYSFYKSQTQRCRRPPWHQNHSVIGNRLNRTKPKLKGKPRVTGLQKHISPEQVVDCYVEAKLALPPQTAEIENLMNKMAFTHKSVTLLYEYNKQQVLLFCDLQTGEMINEKLDIDCHVVLSSTASDPHIVLTKSHLVCVVSNLLLQQEDLVSKVMMYAGASIADAICHINKWGRCSVPLQTLDIGLKQRQLDTVSFFLKSKETSFYPNQSQSDTPFPSSSPLSPPVYLDNFTQLEPALDLLIQTMGDHFDDRPSVQFSRKVADVTLDFLYTVLHGALNLKDAECFSDASNDLQRVLDRIMSHISKVRRCIHHIGEISSKPQGDVKIDDIDCNSGWLTGKDTIEAIVYGVSENRLPELQSYLLETIGPDQARYDQIFHTSMQRVVKYLTNNDTRSSSVILANLGMHVDSKLWEIASLTENGEIRDSILSELETRNSLSDTQRNDVLFVQKLENLVVCQKDESETEPLVEKRNFHLEEKVKSYVPAQTVDMPVDYSECPCVLLDWVRFWSQNTRDLVKFQFSNFKQDIICSDQYVRYLLRSNRLRKILVWFEKMCQEKNKHHLLQTLVGDLMECADYVRQKVMRQCARFYIIPTTSEFHVILHYLHSLGGVLMRPHPLTLVEGHIYPIMQFHKEFILHCVKYNLPSLAWHYCNIHNIGQETLQHVLNDLHDKKWFDMFVHFFSLHQTPLAPQIMYNASLVNAEYLVTTENSPVGDTTDQGQITPLLATLMFSQSHLQKILDGEDPNIKLKDMESAVLPHPKLHSTLFPSSSSIESPRTDITLYDLLKSNAVFDPCQLFSWQTTNSLYAGEDHQQHVPHFAQSELMTKYGYTERLSYTYYLKQGRPSFAFSAFIAEETNSEAEISPQRILEAKQTALWIGVQHFQDSCIACACVVFIEMFGQDSLLLRTMLQVGQEIMVCLNEQLTCPVDQMKDAVKENENKIVSWLCNCLVHRKKCAQYLLQQLETAIEASLKKDNIKRTSFEAGQKWMVVVLYCRLLNLPLTTQFLETCAKADKWLPFLWFSQLHQYTKEQLQSLLYKFRSRHLQQHLHYVIENADSRAIIHQKSVVEPPNPSVSNRNKDLRSSLYSRIGLARGSEQKFRAVAKITKYKKLRLQLVSDRNDLSDEDEREEMAHDQHKDEDHIEDVIEIDKAAIPDDFFQVVFAIQSSKCPWKKFLLYGVALRNPLLTELALCSKEDVSVLTCLCAWLVAMMDEENHGKFLKEYGKYLLKWNLKHLGHIIDIFMLNSWFSTLSKGFAIFQTTSPLLHFLKFSVSLRESKDYKACKAHLEDFKESMSQYSDEEPIDHDMKIIGNYEWLLQTAYKIIQFLIHNTQNQYDLLQFLKILENQNIILLFKFDVPDFGQLARLLQIIVTVQIADVDFFALASSETAKLKEVGEKVMDQLIKRGLFLEARQFAKECCISSDKVTREEIIYKKSQLKVTELWKNSEARKEFWIQTEEQFAQYNTSADIVFDFFMNEGSDTEELEEKAIIYNLGLQNLERDDKTNNSTLRNTLYRKLWLTRIQQVSFVMQTDGFEESSQLNVGSRQSSISIKKQQLLHVGKMPKADSAATELSDNEEKSGIYLVDRMLDDGEISESCRLVAEFRLYNRNLAIILTCIRLSVGAMSIADLEPCLLSLVSTMSGKQHRPSLASISSVASLLDTPSVVSKVTDFLPIEKEKVLVTMETLLGYCYHGVHLCRRVVNCYLIAGVLDKEYDEVIKSKEFDILRLLLRTSFPERFRLAAEFLSTSSLNSLEVAQFLCDSIVETYKVKYANIAGSISDKEGITFNAEDAIPETADFVKLTPSPSQLGDKLLEMVPTLSDIEGDIPQHILAIQTELLVLAHLCHTSACNMEGISMVLRAARRLTVCLQQTSCFQLMVRLLTGIGRFNEMTYIFDSLKLNDRFELLLKKGIEKEKNLKIAILDYLKRHHPQDEETLDMVAHNFLMHREIAQILEKKATKLLNRFKDCALDTSPITMDTLQSITQYYMDAAESYYKEGCLRHAQVCMSHARLVALQLQCLSAGIRVIHMTQEGADQFISSHSRFAEALIVSESYNRKGCWADALCKNVLINGDFKYLQDFKTYFTLPFHLFPEIFERFNTHPNKENYASNVKRLVPYCSDVKLQLKLAREYHLKDLIIGLQRGDNSNFIRDVIATE